jgi:hypothetical protein
MQPLATAERVCVHGASQLSIVGPCAAAASAVGHRKLDEMSRSSRRAPSLLHLDSGPWLRVLVTAQLMVAATMVCQLHEKEWTWRRATLALFDGQRGCPGEGPRRDMLSRTVLADAVALHNQGSLVRASAMPASGYNTCDREPPAIATVCDRVPPATASRLRSERDPSHMRLRATMRSRAACDRELCDWLLACLGCRLVAPLASSWTRVPASGAPLFSLLDLASIPS